MTEAEPGTPSPPAPDGPSAARPRPAEGEGAIIVVKLGGDVIEEPALAVVAADLARLWASGRRMLVVHGGGPQATRTCERLGLSPHVVAGRRVTDAETLDVMKMVVSGRLNVDLVAALRARGLAAVGLSGASGIVNARRRPPTVVAGGGDQPIDFGLVGDVHGFDLRLLHLLLDARYCPVLACLGLAEPEGLVLNINADLVASQLAAACGAAALVAVTRVGGVRRDKDDPATRIARLTVSEARSAIASGVVQGGMIPKVVEAFTPLAAGVGAVHIVAPGEISVALSLPGTVGTLLLAD